MKGIALSDEELKDYSDHHLKYELDMLIWCTGFLSPLADVKNAGHIPWAANNAVMNSYSMHARNLIDFLYLRSLGKDRNTDVIVEDFIEPSKLAEGLPPMPPLLAEAKRKADKQVAHLTTDRIQFEEAGKEWRFIEIALDIARTFNAISGLFPPERTGDAFLTLIYDDRLIVPFIRAKVVQNEQSQNIGITLRLGTQDKFNALGDSS